MKQLAVGIQEPGRQLSSAGDASRKGQRPGLRALPLVLAAAALIGGRAFGADGFYVGGSFGESDEHYDATAFKASSSSTGYEAALGYRPLPVFAGEFDYVNPARAWSGSNYVDTYGVGLYALGFLPVPVVELFGKVGLLDWRTDVQSPLLEFHRSGADLAYGVGAGTRWSNLEARVQLEEFNVAHTRTMSLASVGLLWLL